VLGIVAVPLALGVLTGTRFLGGGGGGGGGGSRCPDPTFVVDVTTFTDEPVDPINVPDLHDVSLQGTLSMDSRHPVNIAGIEIPMATSPDATVYVSLDEPILEPGRPADFDGSGTVQLTGSPVVIPDDSAARVDWQYDDARDSYSC
jgi:hypothetical protein